MHTPSILLRTALFFGCALCAASAARADDPHEAHDQMSKGSKQIHETMMDSAQKAPSMEMSGDVDKDFAKMMASHHRSGIKMAEAEIEYGKNAELKQLAQKIKSSQQMELQKLEKHAEMSH